MIWPTARLNELCSRIYSGGTPMSSNSAYYGGDIPWLRTQEVTFNRIKDTEIKITEAGYENSAANWVPERSVIVAMYGNSAGRSAITEIPLTTNQACCNLLIDPALADYRYVFYALVRNYEALKGQSRGAAQNNLNATQVKMFEIPCPPVSVQQRIGDVISSYDDLIENNRRRIHLLEQSARLLYREWFVRLRFPGHEHVRVDDGVPDGWQRKKLIDLCSSVDYGYTATADKEAIGPKFLRITDIVPETIDWGSVPYCPIEESRFAKFRLIEGDIVIARTGATVGYAKRIHKRHPKAVFASYLVRLRPRPDVDDVMVGVFVESQTYKDYVKANVGGAAQPNANAQVLAAAEMVVPTSAIQREFRDFVMPLIDQREFLQIENEKLHTARNLLLPRLMSGEIPACA